MKNPVTYLLLLLFPLQPEAQNIYGFAENYFVSFNPYTEQADTLIEFQGPPYINLGFRTAIDRYNGRYFFGGDIPGLPGKFHIIDLDSLTISNYPVYPQKIEYDFLHNKLVYEYSGSFYSLDLVTMTIKHLSDIENASGGQVFGQVRTYVPQRNQYVYVDFPDLSPNGAYYVAIDATTGKIVCEEFAEYGGGDAHGLVTNNYTGEIFGNIEKTIGIVDPCEPSFRRGPDITGYEGQLNTQLCVYDHINQKYIVPFVKNGTELLNRYAIVDPYTNEVLAIKNHPFNTRMEQQQMYDKPCPPLINLHDTLFVPIGRRYTWFLNGNYLAATTGLHNYWVPDAPGIYTAGVEFKNYACLSSAVEVTTTSVHDISNQELIIYPNPAQDEAWINNVEGPFKYIVLDMAGKVISEGVSDNNIIPVDQLMSGSYIIQVLFKDRKMAGRMTKI